MTDFVVKTSPHSVAETVNKLEEIFANNADISVMARVNHGQNAENVGLELGESELLIFGNPKLGTTLMQSNPHLGLDLPMKILVWKNAEGTVQLSYLAPSTLLSRYNITDKAELLAKMTAALDGVTDKVIQ